MRKKLLSLILSMVIVLGYPIQASADNFLEGETGTFEETEDGVYELKNSNGTLLLTFIEDDGSAVNVHQENLVFLQSLQFMWILIFPEQELHI